MGQVSHGAPRGALINGVAVATLLAAATWAFGSGFLREINRPPQGGPSPARVVVMTPAAPASGLAPLQTYAVTAPRPFVRRRAPPLLDVPPAVVAPAAEQAGVTASATESAPAPASAAASQSTPQDPSA